MGMRESGENYLETILVLKNRYGYVRSIDVANELQFSKPSVSRALGILKKAELVTVEKSGHINLTEKGLLKANEIYERHNLIAEYLIMTLGVDEETANSDSCKIEHVISDKVFNKIKEYTQNV